MLIVYVAVSVSIGNGAKSLMPIANFYQNSQSKVTFN